MSRNRLHERLRTKGSALEFLHSPAYNSLQPIDLLDYSFGRHDEFGVMKSADHPHHRRKPDPETNHARDIRSKVHRRLDFRISEDAALRRLEAKTHERRIDKRLGAAVSCLIMGDAYG